MNNQTHQTNEYRYVTQIITLGLLNQNKEERDTQGVYYFPSLKTILKLTELDTNI